MANDLEFVLFFTFFVVFVVYVSGLAEVSILDSQGFETFTPEEALNPLTSFFVFFSMLFVTSPVQGVSVIVFSIFILPYTIAIIYLALKWLRGTG